MDYPDDIGFRTGIAGPFHPFDTSTNTSMALLEIPLNIMDVALLKENPEIRIQKAFDIPEKVCNVGGTISLLWHSGTLNNPEYPGWFEAYRQLLKTGYDRHARFMTGAKLVTTYRTLPS